MAKEKVRTKRKQSARITKTPVPNLACLNEEHKHRSGLSLRKFRRERLIQSAESSRGRDGTDGGPAGPRSKKGED